MVKVAPHTVVGALSLAVIASALARCVAGWSDERVLRGGYTVVSAAGESPLRFLYFFLVLIGLVLFATFKRSLYRNEAAVLASLTACHFVCTRFSDLKLADMWATGALTAIIVWCRSAPRWSALLWASTILAVSNIAAALVRPSWAFFVDPSIKNWFFERLAGVESHPNELGFLSAIFCLIVISYPKFRLKGLLVGLLVLCLVAAGSKTSLIAFGVALLVYKRRWRVPLWLVVAATLGSFGVLYASSVFGASEELSLTGRSDFWPVLLRGVESSPWIGLGPEGVEETLINYSEKGFNPGNHAHNTGLQILVEGGGVGLFLYLTMLFYVWKISRKTYLGNAVFTLFVIRSFSETTLPWNQVWLWCFAALYLERVDWNTVSSPIVSKKN